MNRSNESRIVQTQLSGSSGFVETNAVIYFGNSLSQHEFGDEQKRLHTLDQGLHVLADFPKVQIIRRMPAMCAVSVTGLALDVQELQNVLAKSSAATVSLDDATRPMFRAASP